jgi:hypothetical protein
VRVCGEAISIRNASHIWLPPLFDEGLAKPLGSLSFDLTQRGEAYLKYALFAGIKSRPFNASKREALIPILRELTERHDPGASCI